MPKDIVMPPEFPEAEFCGFGQSATEFFPPVLSDEALTDPEKKRLQFVRAWQAVRYRYRTCSECNEEFKALLATASESWQMELGDEELTYKLERSIYLFFMSALSVFDSFCFCLYFLGGAMRPTAFPDVSNPGNVTRCATSKAFRTAFSAAPITVLLTELPKDPGFAAIEEVRNILGHRLSGRRTVQTRNAIRQGKLEIDSREDNWYIPGASAKLKFDGELLWAPLDDLSRLLTALSTAARQFAEAQKSGIVRA